MKLRIPAILGLALLAGIPAFAAQRLVLVEDFTNYNCPPCNAIKDSMDALFGGASGTKIAPLRYHMNWPAADDPFYLFNVPENLARRQYYAVNYVPTFRFDGLYVRDPSDFGTLAAWYSWYRTTIDNLAATSAPIRINLEHFTTPSGSDPDSVVVKIDVIAEQAVSGALRLRSSLQEEWVRIVGFGKFFYVFRDMAPSAGGEVLPDLNPGDSLHFEYVLPYDSVEFHFGRMMTTVWVQNDVGKAVLNAANGFIPDIATDVAPGVGPLRVALEPNAPNPFNPSTAIGFVLDRSGEVRLSVYAPTGRLVTDLVDGVIGQGAHTVTWNGTDRSGREVGSGVYYYRLDTDKTSLTRKMILVR